MSTSRIPALLWRRAWNLGVAYHHEWTMAFGSLVGVDDAELVHARVSAELLTAIHLEWRNETDREERGVRHPFSSEWIDADGAWAPGHWRHSAAHRTGTGRCQWTIDAEGVVTISITRPNGTCDGSTVITVTVAVGGEVTWETPGGDRCFGVRHVEAAVVPLTALGVSTTVPPRIAEAAALFDAAMPQLVVELAAIDHWEDRAESADLPW